MKYVKMNISKTLVNYVRLLVIGLIFFAVANIQAQKKQKKVKIYRVWVKLNDQSKHKGFLYSVDTESINIIYSLRYLKSEKGILNLRAKDIDRMSVRRKGKGLRSTLIGALGTAIAVEIWLSFEDPGSESSYISNETAAVMSGILLGAPIGAIVGASRKKFDINGNEAVFKTKYEEFSKYALIKNLE